MEEDLEFHPLFDKFKKYSVQDDDVRVIQYHKLADSLRLIGIILVIDGHIEKLMAKYCPKYIPKEQQVSKFTFDWLVSDLIPKSAKNSNFEKFC